MMTELSTNTQAILLLTAPLLVGRGTPPADLLAPREYRQLARRLYDLRQQPADLLDPDRADLLSESAAGQEERLRTLLGRGAQLSLALERWQARAIWTLSRADVAYPRRLKEVLRDDAPPVLYGCGNIAALDGGGLAVVGSRDASPELLEYAIAVGELATRAERPIVSGGARGIDQAAMHGALESGGRAIGVLADSLERSATRHEHREPVRDGRLVLVSPYDPGAGFNPGHAMARNKLIYALADAALVVESDLGRGGTWTGAVEQLKQPRPFALYARTTGAQSLGLDALRRKGAFAWPEPADADALESTLTAVPVPVADTQPPLLFHSVSTSSPMTVEEPRPSRVAAASREERGDGTSESVADDLLEQVRIAMRRLLDRPRKASDVAATLGILPKQAQLWLDRLAAEGSVEKSRRGYALKGEPLL